MSKKADLFDPLTFNGDSYVENNNPLAFVDPSGLQVSSGGGQPRTPEHPDPRIGFTFTISFGSFGSRGPNPFLFYGTGPLPQGPPDVDAADVGFWEGVIPVWGSGRQAIVDSNRGCVSGVVVNTALAASDVYLVRSAYKGATKGAWKMSGSLSWKGGSGVRAWYGATRELSFGQHVHHWLIPQGGWGRDVANWIKNNPLNLLPVEPPAGISQKAWHDALHGVGRLKDKVGPMQRVWHGTPDWAKTLGGRVVGGLGQLSNWVECK